MSLAQELREQFVVRHPREAARLLETLPLGEQAALVRSLPPEVAATLISEVLTQDAVHLLEHLEAEQAGAILSHMDTGAVLALLRQVAADRVQSLLRVLPSSARDTLSALMSRAGGTVGELADGRCLALPADISVQQALQRARENSKVRSVIPVLGAQQQLVGVTTLHDLLLADSELAVGRIARPDPPCLRAHDQPPAALAHRAWHDLAELPVVDATGRYLGCLPLSALAQSIERHNSAKRDSTIDTLLTLTEAYWNGLTGLMDDVARRRELHHRDEGADS